MVYLLRWFLLDDPIFIVFYVHLNLIKVIIMIHHHLYQQNNILKKKLIMEVFFVKFGLPRRVKDNGFFLKRFSWEVIKKLFSILIVKVTLITKINFVCFFNLYYCSIYEYLILFCISYLTKEKGSWKSNKFPEVFDSAHKSIYSWKFVSFIWCTLIEN